MGWSVERHKTHSLVVDEAKPSSATALPSLSVDCFPSPLFPLYRFPQDRFSFLTTQSHEILFLSPSNHTWCTCSACLWGKGAGLVSPQMAILFLWECQSISPVLESTARKIILSMARVRASSPRITRLFYRRAGEQQHYEKGKCAGEVFGTGREVEHQIPPPTFLFLISWWALGCHGCLPENLEGSGRHMVTGRGVAARSRARPLPMPETQ